MILVIYIYINLISLNSQIQILSNDIIHYIAVKRYTSCRIQEHEQDVSQFSMKMNEIFSICTEGLNAGKRVSDF